MNGGGGASVRVFMCNHFWKIMREKWIRKKYAHGETERRIHVYRAGIPTKNLYHSSRKIWKIQILSLSRA